MKLRGDLQVSRDITSYRTNQTLVVENLAANRAVDRYDAWWLSLDGGGLARTVELPDATTLPLGWEVVVDNESDAAAEDISVRSYDGSFTGTLLKLIDAPVPGSKPKAYKFTLRGNATSAGIWYIQSLDDVDNLQAAKYVATFVAADWPAAVSGKRTLTSTQIPGLAAVTHLRGVNPVYIIQELSGGNYERVLLDAEIMTPAGNLSLRVTSNDSFDGRVVLV